MITCANCKKDLTHSLYRVAFGDKILCILCYQEIPYKDKLKNAKGEMK